jgi:hypothetical protein
VIVTRTRVVRLGAAHLLAALVGAVLLLQVPAIGETRHYLFSYFTGNGESGLHLAHSTDGLTWSAVNEGRPFLAPEVGSRLMRDPSIVRGPDGTFHMVWTTGWWDSGIGVAHSRDLVRWSAQEWLPVMKHEPTALNAWAPELFFDEPTGEFLIVWASTIPGRFPETIVEGDTDDKRRPLNHRLYVTTTRDFKTYTPTRLFYDGGFNVIDGIIIRHGGEYVLIVKDETRAPVAKKHLRIARAPRALGPYGPASPPITVDWVEGPTALRVGRTWYVYYDEYTRKRYGAIASEDLQTWRVVSDTVQFPEGARHGTAFEVDEATVRGLGRYN